MTTEPGWRRAAIIAALLIALTLVGALGFKALTACGWLDAFYMAVITLTTVGYREAVPLGESGKVFVIAYLIFGLGTFTYSAFYLGQWIVSVQVWSLREARRMKDSVARLRGHYIVCGLGRMGLAVCSYLEDRRRPFVVIDHNEDRLEERCTANGWLFLSGDATDDEVLKAAGIDRAKSLASVLATDADNVYVVLSARMLNSDLQILSRANSEKAVQKLERAGANRIVSPIRSGATKMARFMLNPGIEDFLEIADEHGKDMELVKVHITAQSPYAGRALSETDLRARGLMVLGIRNASGEYLMPPPGTAVIRSGDSLFTFGAAADINAMLSAAEGTDDEG